MNLQTPDPTIVSCDSLPDDAEAVAIGLSEDWTPTGRDLNSRSDGMLEALRDAGIVRGKVGDADWATLPGSAPPRSILVVGLRHETPDPDTAGASRPRAAVERSDREAAYRAGGTAIRSLAGRPREHVAISLAENFDAGVHDAIVAGVMTGLDGQAILKSSDPKPTPQTISMVGMSDAAIERGEILGRAVNHTRRLVNLPANEVYPESFADAAAELAGEVGLTCEVWDEQRLEAEGCRAMLAVGRASAKPPRLVMLRYDGGGKDAETLAVVGKGVTFDSGGLSLKPSDSMKDMKMDMGGAATVVGVMRAVAELKPKVNVVGFCGLAENMISGDAYRLGDVIETRKGTTIEIHNTDAEGRVVLADTLDVCVQHEPAAIVDLATLTGACMVALGNEVVGMMTNRGELAAAVKSAADVEGEYVWELPMYELYDEKIQSKVADIKNVGEGRWGGAITAGKFLEQFVGDTPWVHLDIAGPAFADSSTGYRDAGATGVMVRTLVRWIESRT